MENIQPFTAKELSIRSLADCVLDLPRLHVLYPNRPKHEAFRRDYNSEWWGKGQGKKIQAEGGSIFYKGVLPQVSSSSPVPNSQGQNLTFAGIYLVENQVGRRRLDGKNMA